MKKVLLFVLFLLLVAFIVFLLGPRPTFEALEKDTVSEMSIENIDSVIIAKESTFSTMREGNSAKIIWADSVGKKTEYSVVYLHGFSASHEEGMPTHVNFAKRYGCNLFLSRIDRHGLEDIDAFKGITPQELLTGTEYAIEVGKAIGEKVILMNCSTGSTTGIYLAGDDPRIVGSIHYSPNIDIAGSSDELLIGPWAKKVSKMVFKGEYNNISYSEKQAKYWYGKYHIDGIIALKWLINETMTEETFQKINHPVFMAYYYKNEEEQDFVVSVPRMLDFYDQISTPTDKKRKLALENGRHVMTSHVIPSPARSQVEKETYSFAEEILGLKPIK